MPCFQVLPQEPTTHTSPPYPLLSGCHVRMSPHSHLGRVGRVQGPQPKPARASLGPRLDVGAAQGMEARKDGSAVRCDPGCCFSGGDSFHKGPFVLSFPWLGLHCSPLRRAQWDIVQSRKGPLVQPPARWALGSLPGFAQGGRGHQRVHRELMFSCLLQGPPLS